MLDKKELSHLKSTLSFVVLFWILVFFFGSAAQSSVNSFSDIVDLKTFRTHSRLSFKLDQGVQPTWKDKKNGFEIFFKGIALADMGVPFGGEKAWSQKIKKEIADERLSEINIAEGNDGVLIEGKWKFPTGKQEPAYPKMEKFDFWQKGSVSRYVVDFWHKSGPTLIQARAEQEKQKKELALKKAQEQARLRKERRIASAKKKEEMNNLLKYCREPLDQKNNVILPLTPLHEDVNFSNLFPMVTADGDYHYLEPSSSSEDAQYVSLILKLYREGKYALAIRTADFLNTEYPNSTFISDMDFLKANAMIKLSFQDEAKKIFEKLVLDGKKTPVSLYAGMYLAGHAYNNKEFLAALERFSWLMQNYPNHRLNWAFHLGAAESLYSMKQTERAAKEYQWIVDHAEDRKVKADAAIRIGNLYLYRKQYPQALAAYFRASNYFKEEVELSAAYHLNRAEALFWLDERERAEKSLITFLEKFKSHPEGWRATYRIGELNAMKSEAPTEEFKESNKWYFDTINNYPTTVGATLARARLLPCGNHGGMDYHAAVKYFNEDAVKVSDSKDFSNIDYNDYTALAQVRTMISMDRNDQAVAIGVRKLSESLTEQSRALISALLKKSFRKRLINMLDEGKNFEALAFYDKFAKSMPDSIEVISPDYLLKLAQAANDLNLGSLGQKFSQNYHAQMNQLKKMSENGETRYLASIDEGDQLEGALFRSNEKFIEGKSQWLSHGVQAESQIRANLIQVVEEYQHAAESNIILGLLDEKKGEARSALGHALKAQVLLSHPQEDMLPRLKYWIASLYQKIGDFQASEPIFRELESLGIDRKPAQITQASIIGLPEIPTTKLLIVQRAEMHESQNQWEKAASVYQDAINQGFETNQILFGHARALKNTNQLENVNKANDILKKIAEGKTDDFWKKLATELIASKQ